MPVSRTKYFDSLRPPPSLVQPAQSCRRVELFDWGIYQDSLYSQSSLLISLASPSCTCTVFLFLGGTAEGSAMLSSLVQVKNCYLFFSTIACLLLKSGSVDIYRVIFALVALAFGALISYLLETSLIIRLALCPLPLATLFTPVPGSTGLEGLFLVQPLLWLTATAVCSQLFWVFSLPSLAALAGAFWVFSSISIAPGTMKKIKMLYIIRNKSSCVTATVPPWQHGNWFDLLGTRERLKKKQIIKKLPLIMLAVCNTLLFAVAGVFSSSVIRAVGRQTLISSSHCGFLAVNINNTGPSVIEDFSRLSNETLAAIMYSRECYGASNQLQCDSFPQPQLASTSEMNVSCPFQSQICIEGPNAAFQVKSGWIDTDKDLGINSKASDRLQYRKVTTCSVLHTTGYIHQSNITNSSHASFEVSYYNYGSLDPFNFTFSHSRQESEIANGYILA